jgi:hypothetical protein
MFRSSRSDARAIYLEPRGGRAAVGLNGPLYAESVLATAEVIAALKD